MKTLLCLLFIFGVAVLSVVTCAPMCKHPRGPPVAITCNQLCPDEYHPVCAVDAQGLPKTFANRCFVDFAYCREGKYYAIMKDGEC
ncbi:UNVERIFIED_CONTAM: hypothetical protein PYX00_007810 [Menopon gallinae]|uniref:Kazal-like domain-containing protein n=1 Tax=Menopon gallinae TaxID=328185 RepID=A0AAW2HKE8_9NEOP